MNSDASDS
jgi:pre-rRNA-processing protein TSR1